MAESFGAGADLYDRARPRYPDALIEAIVAVPPGRNFLDVGAGTGITARQFQAAGCQVLGVDVDERMAAFARGTGRRGRGVTVRVVGSGGPDLRRRGRRDDVALDRSERRRDQGGRSTTTGGRLAVFWYVLQPPPEIAEAFAAVYREVLPDSPVNDRALASPLAAYDAFLDKAADGLRGTGAFDELERSQYPWSRAYTRDEWLDQIRTGGNAKQLADAGKLDELLTGMGAADRRGRWQLHHRQHRRRTHRHPALTCARPGCWPGARFGVTATAWRSGCGSLRRSFPGGRCSP